MGETRRQHRCGLGIPVGTVEIVARVAENLRMSTHQPVGIVDKPFDRGIADQAVAGPISGGRVEAVGERNKSFRLFGCGVGRGCAA